jgi:hypothetical protein
VKAGEEAFCALFWKIACFGAHSTFVQLGMNTAKCVGISKTTNNEAGGHHRIKTISACGGVENATGAEICATCT